MTAEEMGERIVERVAKSGWVSFAEIIGELGPEAKGDMAWGIVPNLFLWVGMSTTLIEAFQLVKDRIRPHPSSLLVYLADGAALQLPIAKRAPKNGYKKKHWLPVTFNLSPSEKVHRKSIGRGFRDIPDYGKWGR